MRGEQDAQYHDAYDGEIGIFTHSRCCGLVGFGSIESFVVVIQLEVRGGGADGRFFSGSNRRFPTALVIAAPQTG